MNKPLIDFEGEDVESVLAACNYTNKKLAQLFGVNERTIYRWKAGGAPPHIAVVLDALVSGHLRPCNIHHMLARIPPSRRDGDRYG